MTSDIGSPSSYAKRLHFLVPQADEQPFRYALYNVVLLVFVAICIAAALSLYQLFHAFIQPIVWACLVGSVIFPLKNNISHATKQWLKSLRRSGTPLVVGVAISPLHLLDYLEATLTTHVSPRTTVAFVLSYPALNLVARFRLFSYGFVLLMGFITSIDSLIAAVPFNWLFPVWLIYTATYVVWVWLQTPDEPTGLSRAPSFLVWSVGLCLFASLFGPLRSLVFLGVLGICLVATFLPSALGKEEPSEVKTTVYDSQDSSENSRSRSPSAAPPSSMADTYIRYTAIACAGLWAATHPVVMYIGAVVLLYSFVKQKGESFGVWSRIVSFITSLRDRFFSSAVVDTVVPAPIKKLLRMAFDSDQAIIRGLEGSMDELSSVLTMLVVLVAAVSLNFFVVFQVHREVLHLVDVSSSVFDNTVTNGQGQISKWVSDALGDRTMSDVVEDGYMHGRVWLSTQVRSLVPDDPKRADMLEAQVKEIVDKLYHDVWLNSALAGSAANSSPLGAKLNAKHLGQDEGLAGLWTHLRASLDIQELKEELINVVKNNVETLKSVANSVAGILQDNISLISSLVLGLTGLIFSFGFELLNLVVEMVVFLTVLYYLLAVSKTSWKPFEWLNQSTPSASAAQPNSIVRVMEEAIRSVFVSSAKKAIFYGIYTWFVLTLFDLNVVFIPSVFASLLAVVPLTAPYWVCVPGVLELWLARDEPALAALCFLANLLPMMMVDTELNNEIRGSHPYLTGLSIVGGMYWLGLQGALVGPMLLCLCLVLFHLYRNMWRADEHEGDDEST